MGDAVINSVCSIPFSYDMVLRTEKGSANPVDMSSRMTSLPPPDIDFASPSLLTMTE